VLFASARDFNEQREGVGMNEIRVIARALARTGKEEQLRNTFLEMLAPTRAEQGCRLYDLYGSNNNKGLFYFYEEWESQDALDRHTETPHYKQLAQSVRNLLEGAFEVNVLDVLG
jgi:quinol monooxygenase YgiN